MKPQKSPKKFNLVVGILVLLTGISIGGYLVLKSKTVSTKNGETNQARESLKEIITIRENDSDKDGLADWQETLFGTDKNNPDTDNDGYLDGEEVLSGHDPLKPAPDDKLLKEALTNKDNLTQYFAQQLASQMSSLSPTPNAQSLLKVSAQDILNNLSSEEMTDLKSIGLIFVPEPIKEEDLKTVKTTKQSVFDYLKEIETALSKNKDVYEDTDTFRDVLKTGDFSKIKQIATIYENDYQDIKILAVPSDFSSFHLELLNILALTKTSLESFSQLNEDPVKAYLGLEMYKQACSLLPNFFKKLIDQLALIYPE